MKRIERHRIDDVVARELPGRWSKHKSDLPLYVESALKDVRKLFLLIDRAWATVAYGSVIEPDSAEIVKAAKLGAEACVAMFAAVDASAEYPKEVTIASQTTTYHSPPDMSTVYPSRWTLGFFLSVIGRDVDSVTKLATSPVSSLQSSSTISPEYHYALMDALKEFTLKKPDVVKSLLHVLELTDPKRSDIKAPDWVLLIDVPMLEVLIYAVTGDARFTDAFPNAIAEHKKFWSKTKDRRCDSRGYVSIPLTAIAVLAGQRQLEVTVQSDYIPQVLLG